MSTTTSTAPAAAASAAPAMNAPAPGDMAASDATGPVDLLMAKPEAVAAPDSPAESGMPAKDFWSRGIKVGGEYVTTDRATGKKIRFAFTPEMASDVMLSWERMKQKGVKVPIVRDHSVKAADTLGWMTDLRREGDWIKTKLRAVGNNAIDTVAVNQISLGLKPNFEDGTGETYKFAIHHVGSTPIPVVPDLGGMIAAARSAEIAGSILLSLAPDPTPLTEQTGAPADARGTGSALDSSAAGVTTSAAPAPPPAARSIMDPLFTPELRKKVVGRLADPEKDAALHAELSKADDATLLSRLVEDHDHQCTDLAAWLPYAKAQEAAAQVNLSRAEEAEEKLTGANARNVELSRETTAASELTPQEILLAREGPGVMAERHTRVSREYQKDLLAYGYSPAAVQKVCDLVVGTKDNVNAVFLSRIDGSTECYADALHELLLSMKPDAPKPGEATALPRVDLARDGGATGGADPKEVDEMRRLQGLPPKKA